MSFMKGCIGIFLIIFTLIFPLVTEEKGEAYRGLASSWNVIPSRSLAGLHYLFKGYELDDDKGSVKVTGPVVEIINGEELGAKVFRDGYSTEIDSDDFEEEQALGKAVFEATTRNGNDVGTAFLVGNNIVFTNRHVLNYQSDSRIWQCGKFSIKLNHRDERVECEKIRFCSSKHDFCVIQMKKMSNGYALSSEIRPLRLTQKVRPDQDATLLHIGNAAGMGIQASYGQGIKIRGGEFFHYAPTLGGSSGAPIFNEKREVIGLNWGHNGGTYIDESSFNRGVLAVTIFDELLKTHIHTLKEVKSFRSWLHRKNSHRKVRVRSR